MSSEDGEEVFAEFLVKGPGMVTTYSTPELFNRGMFLYDDGWFRPHGCVRVKDGDIRVVGYMALVHVYRWFSIHPEAHEDVDDGLDEEVGLALSTKFEVREVNLSRVTFLLNTHPDVKESFALGLQLYGDTSHRRRVGALVVLEPGSRLAALDLQSVKKSLHEWCSVNMDSKQQIPQVIQIADNMPKFKSDNRIDPLQVGKILFDYMESNESYSCL